MITQDEIARKLGVSRATVARALNGSENIKKETKEKILEYIKEIGYEKNALGFSLAIKNEKKIVVFLVESINKSYSDEIERGIKAYYKEIKHYKVNLEIKKVKISEVEKQILELKKVLKGNVDGVIIVPLDPLKAEEELLKKEKLKIVTIGNKIKKADYFIDSRYKESGRIVGNIFEKMISKDKKILIIDGGDDHISSKVYLNGVIEKLDEKEREYVGPIFVDNLLENFKLIEEYLIDEIEGLYFNRYVPEILNKIDSKKLKDKKVVCNGYSLKIKNLIEKEKIVAAVAEDFYNQGYKSMKKMFELLYKNIVKEEKKYDTRIEIFFKENLK